MFSELDPHSVKLSANFLVDGNDATKAVKVSIVVGLSGLDSYSFKIYGQIFIQDDAFVLFGVSAWEEQSGVAVELWEHEVVVGALG